jgi:hypothetical protein
MNKKTQIQYIKDAIEKEKVLIEHKTKASIKKIVDTNERDFDFSLEVFSNLDMFDSTRTYICDVLPRKKYHVTGFVRSTLLVPVNTDEKNCSYSFETTLFDGTGYITLIWFGRSSVRGIDSERLMSVYGLVVDNNGQKFMYNPKYDFAIKKKSSQLSSN